MGAKPIHPRTMASASFHLSDLTKLRALAQLVSTTVVEEILLLLEQHSIPILPPTPVGPRALETHEILRTNLCG